MPAVTECLYWEQGIGAQEGSTLHPARMWEHTEELARKARWVLLTLASSAPASSSASWHFVCLPVLCLASDLLLPPAPPAAADVVRRGSSMRQGQPPRVGLLPEPCTILRPQSRWRGSEVGARGSAVRLSSVGKIPYYTSVYFAGSASKEHIIPNNRAPSMCAHRAPGFAARSFGAYHKVVSMTAGRLGGQALPRAHM